MYNKMQPKLRHEKGINKYILDNHKAQYRQKKLKNHKKSILSPNKVEISYRFLDVESLITILCDLHQLFSIFYITPNIR